MPRESDRDQIETEFTPILRMLFRSVPGSTAVVFVDDEGETVDYCSSADPFSARVIGAQLQVTAREIARVIRRLGGGEMSTAEVWGSSGQLIVRRLGGGYFLMVATEEPVDSQRVTLPIEEAVAALRAEGALAVPHWDPVRPPLRVLCGDSEAWGFAPATVGSGDREKAVTVVLGSWKESPGLLGSPQACFRVQFEDGTEMTLAYDADHDRWWPRKVADRTEGGS